jgi:hypothetical protein
LTNIIYSAIVNLVEIRPAPGGIISGVVVLLRERKGHMTTNQRYVTPGKPAPGAPVAAGIASAALQQLASGYGPANGLLRGLENAYTRHRGKPVLGMK